MSIGRIAVRGSRCAKEPRIAGGVPRREPCVAHPGSFANRESRSAYHDRQVWRFGAKLESIATVSFIRSQIRTWTIAWLVFQAASLSAHAPRDCCAAHKAHRGHDVARSEADSDQASCHSHESAKPKPDCTLRSLCRLGPVGRRSTPPAGDDRRRQLADDAGADALGAVTDFR